MATASILQLTQALSLLGTEQLEAVQAGSSVRVSASQIAALAVALLNPTEVAYAVPAIGQNDNYTAGGQMGPLIGFLELTPTANCNITGLEAGFNGQVVVITNLSSFAIVLNSLNSGSLPPNQFRMVFDVTLIQNDSKSFKYSTTIGKWLAPEF